MGLLAESCPLSYILLFFALGASVRSRFCLWTLIILSDFLVFILHFGKV
jgi:hypothetical protein